MPEPGRFYGIVIKRYFADHLPHELSCASAEASWPTLAARAIVILAYDCRISKVRPLTVRPRHPMRPVLASGVCGRAWVLQEWRVA